MDEIFMAGPSITELEEKMVLDAVKNGWYGKDAYKYCELFEYEFANYHDRKYGLMTPNCTTAIHLLLAGLGIKDGDDVIAPECTWIASVAPVTYQRANTVFADIEEDSWCLCPKSTEKKITNKTKAIIAVNLYGNMANMDKLTKLADEYNLHLIEDAAESVGSTYKGVKSGKFGVGSVFSFHRTKTITTGEGGMLLLDDDELYKRCKFLRDHGRAPGTYFNTEVTFKYMPFNVQAALGYAQFQRMNELVDKKRFILEKYKEHLKDIPHLQFNHEPPEVYNGVWCVAAVFGKEHNLQKPEIMERLSSLGLPVRPFFYPLSSLPAFNGNENTNKDIHPVAYDVSSRGINLPSALNITEKQIISMCDGVKKMLEMSKISS